MPIDIFSKTTEVSFRGISFPVSSFKSSFTQDMAVHKFPNQDGAIIENTGRNPAEFSITAPMFAGLWKGPNETWENLYPDTFIKLINACNDPTPGTLVHPMLGMWNVCLKDLQTSMEATKRNGEEISMNFIETIIVAKDQEDARNLENTALSSAVANASAIDAQLYGANKNAALLAVLNKQKVTLPSSNFSTIVSLIDRASLAQKQFVGKINNARSQITRIKDALDRANDTSTAQMKILFDNLSADLETINLNILSSRKIKLHLTRVPTTLAGLSKSLDASLEDLGNLNPQFLKQIQIPVRSVIRYYK